MTPREKEQLDKLLSEIGDEGLSSERIARLEQLLVNRPDLQAYYTSATTVQSLLRYELKSNMGLLQPLVGVPNATQPVAATGQKSGSTPGHSSSSNSGLSNARSMWVLLAAIAASVVFVATALLLAGSDPQDTRLANIDSGNRLPDEHAQPQAAAPTIEVTDPRQLATLSRTTRTDVITRVLLPAELAKDASPNDAHRLVGGNVWIDRTPNGRERGYVVALAPGYRMDVRLDSDAGSQNALGVVELDATGRLTGDTLSFNNLGGTPDFANRRYGNIGEFTITNEGATAKFFLFAGSHLNQSGQWRQSDYDLLHESIDFLVLGWDDSGFPGTAPIDASRDRDFNDVSTILHFSPLSSAIRSHGDGVFYAPLPLDVPQKFTGQSHGYQVDVTPGQKLLMLVSNSARIPNTLSIVDHDTREIMWQDESPEIPASELVHETSTRGIYVIKNNSPKVKRYEIHVQREGTNTNEQGTLIDLPHKVNGQEDHSELIGFEDSPDNPAMVDWNDVQVHARWFNK